MGLHDNVLFNCPHYGICTTPLYTGSCRPNCIESYNAEIFGTKVRGNGKFERNEYMKAIDIVKVKQNIKSGLLATEIHNGFILLKDVKSGEAVVIGEITKEEVK